MENGIQLRFGNTLSCTLLMHAIRSSRLLAEKFGRQRLIYFFVFTHVNKRKKERRKNIKNSQKMTIAVVVLAVFGLCLISTTKLPRVNTLVPSIESYDSTDTQRDDFLVGEDAYARGGGYQPNTQYFIMVFDDGLCYSNPPADHPNDIVWTGGMPIPSGPIISVVTVTTDALGNIPLTRVVTSVGPVGQCYDMVVDVNGNGVYNVGVDALDDNDTCHHDMAGFFVVPEYALGALLALVACFAAFVVIKRKDIHSPQM